MRSLLIILLLFVIKTSFKAQSLNKEDIESLLLMKYNIEEKQWICNNTLLDTLYNPDFAPNPILIPSDIALNQGEKVYCLNIVINQFQIDKLNKTINIDAIIAGGWHGGWGSEVLIVVGTRQDTVRKYTQLIHGYDGKLPLRQSYCVRFKNIDYCYSDASLKDTKEYRLVKCELTYKNDSDILFFGLNNCYAELFDLKKIIEFLEE